MEVYCDENFKSNTIGAVDNKESGIEADDIISDDDMVVECYSSALPMERQLEIVANGGTLLDLLYA